MPTEVVKVDAVRVADAVVERFLLRCGDLAVHVLTAGCAITSLEVPDRAGRVANVVLSHGDVGRYVSANREYFGVLVGRVANRIADARFTLDGRVHRLAANDGANHLHGGVRGFDRQVWQVVETSADDAARLRLHLVSPDGDEGYPGTVAATVTYTLLPHGELRQELEAVTDAPTLVNLTHHAYFNLNGSAGDILGHELQIDAEAFCPVDATLIPTGVLQPVAGSPFDFRTPRSIGDALASNDVQLARAGGFDHCFALRGWEAAKPSVRRACVLRDAASGRRLTIATDQPGVQFYSGNFLDGTARGPAGQSYGRHAGLCLETQHFPDAPHRPGFPSIELRPGERYRTVTTWSFDV